MTRLEFLQCTWIFACCKQSYCESTKKGNKSPKVCRFLLHAAHTCEKNNFWVVPSSTVPFLTMGAEDPTRETHTEPMVCWHRNCVEWRRRSWALCRREMDFTKPGEQRWSSRCAACKLHLGDGPGSTTAEFAPQKHWIFSSLLWLCSGTENGKPTMPPTSQDRDWEVQLYQAVFRYIPKSTSQHTWRRLFHAFPGFTALSTSFFSILQPRNARGNSVPTQLCLHLLCKPHQCSPTLLSSWK